MEKAKNIKSKVSAEKSLSRLSYRIQRRESQINNIETITTNTEAEAFLLESNLIKKFKPRYNIVLRDDKSLPYILITNKNKWPQISKHRGKQKKNGIYFGPYPSARIVDQTINSLQKAFLVLIKTGFAANEARVSSFPFRTPETAISREITTHYSDQNVKILQENLKFRDFGKFCRGIPVRQLLIILQNILAGNIIRNL